jgi:hypothetical protein
MPPTANYPIRNIKELLISWRWEARAANVAHLRATDSLSWRNFVLGGTSAALGAIVGLGIFATLQEGAHHLWVRIVAGGVAFLATGLAALWKYLSYSERVEKHRVASRDYGNIVRQIDLVLGLPTITEVAAEKIRKAIDKTDTDSPNVSPFIWMGAVEAVDEERRTKKAVDASTAKRGLETRLGRLWKRVAR